MGTTLRAELSEKNPYWIEKHRYYELKHFCLQYSGLNHCHRELGLFCRLLSCHHAYGIQHLRCRILES